MDIRKFLSALALVFACASVAYAGPVSVEQARAVALKSMGDMAVKAPGRDGKAGGGNVLVLAKAAKAAVKGNEPTPLYYIFNKGEDGGMVIVAGDDRMRPILGYTDRGGFSEAGLNPGLRWWLEAVGEAAEAVAASDGGGAYQDAAYTGTAAVGPLVQTHWGQGSPYNMLCPYDDAHSGRSVTGCVATSMAQLMYYWRYPERGKGTVEYTTKTHGIKVYENLAGFRFNYDKMRPEYTGYEYIESKEAVAELMYACGVAVEMNYCSRESGATIDVGALIGNFGMDSVCNQVYRENFTSAEWNAIIRHELDQKRPLLYSGGSASGRHMFICDGYDETGLFHINWGWSGSDDGYFDLTSLDPYGIPGEGFVSGQHMVYGIKPEGEPGDVLYDNQMYYMSLENTTEGDVSRGDTIRYKAYEVLCRSKHFDGYIGTALYDGDGVMVDGSYCYSIDLDRNHYYREVDMEYVFTGVVPDGAYRLVPICGTTDGEPYAMTPVKGKGLVDYLTVTVSGGTASVTQPAAPRRSLGIDGGPEIEGGAAYAGYPSNVGIRIKNNGAYFSDILTVAEAASGSTVFENDFIIDEGETKDFLMEIDFGTGAGDTEYEVYFLNADNTRNVVGRFTVAVAEPAPGEPDIAAEAVTLGEKVVRYGDKMTVSAAYANLGGFYDGYSCLRVDAGDGHYYVNPTLLRLNAGERKVVESEVDVKSVLDELGIKEMQGTVRPSLIDLDELMIVTFDIPVSFAVTADGEAPGLMLSVAGGAEVAGGKAYAGSKAVVSFSVANGGIAYGGVVKVAGAADGESVYRGILNVAEGRTAVVTMDMKMPFDPGLHSYEVSVMDIYDQWQPIGTLVIDVERASAGVTRPVAGGADGGRGAVPVYTADGVYAGTSDGLGRLPAGVYVVGGRKLAVGK